MTRTTGMRLLGLLALAGTASVGCGGEEFTEQSGTDVLAEASANMADMRSARVQGEVSVEGVRLGIDVSVDRPGNCRGTLTVNGSDLSVIRLANGESFVRGDASSLRGVLGPRAAQVGDRWVVDDDDSFVEFCDLDLVLGDVDDLADFRRLRGATNEGVEDRDGVRVVRVSGRSSNGAPAAIFVTADEPHRIVAFEQGGDESGSISLSERNKKVRAQAPPRRRQVDLDPE